jgi:hypothetical protein
MVLIAAFVILSAHLSFAQSVQRALFYNEGSSIVVNNSAWVNVQGDVTNAETGTIDNSGTIKFYGDWTNNANNEVFINHSPGTVDFYGTNQWVKGSNPTRFHSVLLSGDGIKTQLGVNAYVEGIFNLVRSEWATNSNLVTVTNTNVNAILRQTGFISSDSLGGYLVRHMSGTGNYLFPVGSNGLAHGTAARYRPVFLRPNVAGANSFAVRFANLDATHDKTDGGNGFNRDLRPVTIAGINPLFYHNISRTAGTSTANIRMYYFSGDGEFSSLSQWQDIGYWNDDNANVQNASGIANTDGADRVAVLNNWDDFSPDPFALSYPCVLNTPGTIAGNQTGCGSYDPTAITSTAPATTDLGDIEYQWQMTTDGGLTWTDIPNTNSAGYDPPIISQTTVYRRGARAYIWCIWSYTNNVTKTVVPAPVANNDAFALCPGGVYTDRVEDNDLNLATTTFTIITNPTKGTVTIDNTGKFTYTPNGFQCTTDAFTYRVCNTGTPNCCSTATVTLNMSDNTPPTLVNVPADETISCDDEIQSPPVVTASDYCPVISIDLDETIADGGSAGCNNYTITRTWSSADVCGNTVVDNQTISVQDLTPPQIYKVYTLPNGKRLVAGVMEQVSHRWKTIDFPVPFATTPVVLTSIITTNEPSAAVTQLRNLNNFQFELKIKEEEANDGLHQVEKVAWLAIEPGSVTGDYPLEANTLTGFDHTWKTVNFSSVFAQAPSFIASTQTTLESDPVSVRTQALGLTSVQVFLEEERSADTEIAHLAENIGYLAVERNTDLTDQDGTVFGETGRAMTNHNWLTINFKNKYINPVVVVGGMSRNGAHQGTLRVKDLSSTGFQVQVDEWDYLDGTHPNESFSYIVIEGSIPYDLQTKCVEYPPNLELGTDLVANDNCDGNLAIGYSETLTWSGSNRVASRTWEVTDGCGNQTQYTLADTCQSVAIRAKAQLQGAKMGTNNTVLMRDDLRVKNLLPLEEPYADMSEFEHHGPGGGEIVQSAMFEITGSNAIVDWVFLELRDAFISDSVIATTSGLLQRNGCVVNTQGDSIIAFPQIAPDDYYLAIRHRNHLGNMTKYPIFLDGDSPVLVDFTDTTLTAYGANSRKIRNGKAELWAGDFNSDGKTIYQGPNNDVFTLFQRVISSPDNTSYLANYIVQGYLCEDVNLDGISIYQGPNNDRSKLLLEVILAHPSNTNLLANFIVLAGLP